MIYNFNKYILILALFFIIGCGSKSENTTGPNNDPHVIETSEDPNVPYVRKEWKQWIINNHYRISSLSSEDFADLEFLQQFLQNKSIVQIGEVAHGIAEQNRLRVRIIKYLHQSLGFNVIAFESGFYECLMMNNEMENLSALEALKNTLYSFWCTTDLLDLFEYIKQSRTSGNDLILAGLDIQPTGDYIKTRPHFFETIMLPIDPTFANQICKADSILLSFSYSDQKVYIQNNYEVLLNQYEQLRYLIVSNESLLVQNFDQSIIFIAKQSARSAKAYIRFRNGDLYDTEIGGTNVRDGFMVQNLRFIKEEMFPNQKIIIWAHNIHTHKDSYAITDPLGNRMYSIMMGDLLNHRYQSEYYAIGSLSYRGRINYGAVSEIKIRRDESVEAILYHARKKQFFLNLSDQEKTIGNSWIFQPTFQLYLHRSGEYEIKYIPKNQYDAYLYIDTVSEPQYIY